MADAKQLSSKKLGSANAARAKRKAGAKFSGAAKVSPKYTQPDEADKVPNHLPSVTSSQHNDLLSHVLTRVAEFKYGHDRRMARYNRILVEIAAQQVITDTEYADYHDSIRPVIRNIRYPKTFGHLRDVTINVMNTLFPMRQMYGSIAATPADQQLLTSFLQEMNRHSKSYSHYNNYYRAIFDSLAFNAGITEVEWDVKTATVRNLSANPNNREAGNLLDASQDTRNTAYASRAESGDYQERVVRRGNKIKYIDPYNAFWDDTIPSVDFNIEADFFAYVERVTADNIRSLARQGKIVVPKAIEKNLRKLDRKLDAIVEYNGNSVDTHTGYYGKLYSMVNSSTYDRHDKLNGLAYGLYRERPSNLVDPIIITAGGTTHNNPDGSFNGEKFLQNASDLAKESVDPRRGDNELLHVFVKIVPADFGIGEATQETFFKITILNGEYIVAFRPAGEAHGLLPVTIAAPSEELGHSATPSVASILSPFQVIANSLLSTFVTQAANDAEGGITAYDSGKVNLNNKQKDRTGYVPVSRDNPESNNIPLQNFFAQIPSSPANQYLIQAEELIRQRANDFSPTASANQLATMNRPVTHQSRQLTAVMNLHTHVLSRLLSEQMIHPNNLMQARNIMLYSEAIPYTDENGQPAQIRPAQFEEVDLTAVASDGMRGLDTLAIIDRFENVLNSIYQSPQLAQSFDIVKLTSYLFQLEGAEIDVDAFRYPDQFSTLTPEQKQAAVELLQQAAAQEQSVSGQGNPTPQGPAQA